MTGTWKSMMSSSVNYFNLRSRLLGVILSSNSFPLDTPLLSCATNWESAISRRKSQSSISLSSPLAPALTVPPSLPRKGRGRGGIASCGHENSQQARQ
eukprot:745853-Hanusia_phi.AAC.5